MNHIKPPAILLLNQMAGPLTWELAEDLGKTFGPVALLTGHPDTTAKNDNNLVRVYQAATYQRGSQMRRILTWLLYLLQSFFWLWRWPKEIPILIFSNPPLLPWLGYLMHILRGQRFIVMVHDIYPDLLFRLGALSPGSLIGRFWIKLNQYSYEHAEEVMTLGEYMSANLAKQFNVNKISQGKIRVVYPWADTDVIRPIFKMENWFAKNYDQVDKLTVMYSGNMGLGHDIETILSAAYLLRTNHSISFMLIGAGPKWHLVEDTIRAQKLENVKLLPWQSEGIIPYSLAAADVALVSLEKDIEGLAVPSKSFYSLAAGSALVIISGEENEAAAIVKRFNCGWVIGPGQAEELATLLLSLDSDPQYLKQVKSQSRLAAEEIGSRKNSLAIIESIKQLI